MSKTTLLEEQALRCEAVASELDKAAQHMRTMAGHFRAQEVPRAAAHALAAQGHMDKAKQTFSDVAIHHAAKATPA